MNAGKFDNMEWSPGFWKVFWSEAQISEINEKAIPINTKNATKFGLGVFQGNILFLSIVHKSSKQNYCNAITRNNCP